MFSQVSVSLFTWERGRVSLVPGAMFFPGTRVSRVGVGYPRGRHPRGRVFRGRVSGGRISKG